MRLPSLLSPGLWCGGIAAALAFTTMALHAGEPDPSPPWVAAAPDPAIVQRIRAFEIGTARMSESPLSLIGPDGRPLYYFIGPCCDNFNRLYDADGRFICAPSGGFTGAGDGKCPGWVHDERLWRRLRLPAAGAEPPSAPR